LVIKPTRTAVSIMGEFSIIVFVIEESAEKLQNLLHQSTRIYFGVCHPVRRDPETSSG